MSRAVRFEFDGAFYHVMSRGVARMAAFPDVEDRRHLRSDSVRVEEAVSIPFAGATRRGRLLLCAQRAHSRLRPIEIGQRYGRRHSAVAMAVRAIEAEARTNTELAERLSKFTSMSQESDE